MIEGLGVSKGIYDGNFLRWFLFVLNVCALEIKFRTELFGVFFKVLDAGWLRLLITVSLSSMFVVIVYMPFLTSSTLPWVIAVSVIGSLYYYYVPSVLPLIILESSYILKVSGVNQSSNLINWIIAIVVFLILTIPATFVARLKKSLQQV